MSRQGSRLERTIDTIPRGRQLNLGFTARQHRDGSARRRGEMRVARGRDARDAYDAPVKENQVSRPPIGSERLRIDRRDCKSARALIMASVRERRAERG